jgi:hypothetical protein
VQLSEKLHIFAARMSALLRISLGLGLYSWALSFQQDGKYQSESWGMPRMVKYVLVGLAVLYVAWTIFKVVMNWIDAKMVRKP